MGKPPFHEGDVVKHYVIDKQFNVGGMGAVYSIKQENILIKAPFSDSGDVLLAQFKEEVKALQQLNHPGIVGILDSDINAEIPWYTMEFIQGETLRAYLSREAPVSPLRSLRLIYLITESISHAHTQSKPIWHLDIKPENICFREDKPVILDFGLARFGRSATNILGPHGTLLYMAPEQLDLRGRPNARADVYALGVLFFEMLTGDTPFGKISEVCYENKRIECMEKILDLNLAVPKMENIDPSVQRILDKTLSKKQEHRYLHAGEMLSDIRNAFQIYIRKYVARYEKNNDYSRAVHILEEGFCYGLVSKEELDRLTLLKKEQEAKSLEEIITTGRKYNNFQKTLDYITNIAQRYQLETDPQTKKRIYEQIEEILQVKESESWALLSEKLQTVKKLLLTIRPSILKQEAKELANNSELDNDYLEIENIEIANEVKTSQEVSEEEIKISEEEIKISEEETKISQEEIKISEEETKISKEEIKISEEEIKISEEEIKISEEETNISQEKTKISQEKTKISEEEIKIPEEESKIYQEQTKNLTNDVVFEEETQIIQVPPSQMANYIASPLEINQKKTNEEVRLITSDFEVILEQSQTLKTENLLSDQQMSIKLPNGFHWFDDTHIICEKDESLMVYIPGGEFIMGDDFSSFEIAKPQHIVHVDGFFMDKYLITWYQFLMFCEATGHQQPTPPRWGIYEEHPVVNISWLDAKAYCIWAGKILATEAQWEKVAKGGLWLDGDDKKKIENPNSKRMYPWGEETPNEDGKWKANYNDEPHYGRNRGQKSTSHIGSFGNGASIYGCLDMAGNVWEWCKDWYGENYYAKSAKRNPKGPSRKDATKIDTQKSDVGKVLRGGSWYTGSKFLRTTARRCRNPEGRGGSCGMRGVCNIVK